MKKIYSFLIVFILATISIFAQSDASNYVHDFMQKLGYCKSGAITDNYGYVILYDRNSAVWAGIPQSLADYLKAEYDSGRTIDDVTITEQGNWLCLGDNIQCSGAPQKMWNKMEDFLEQGDRINCVTFNDYGDWIIITDKHFLGSDEYITNVLIETKNKYGFIRTASMNNAGFIIVGNDGFVKIGNIPDDLAKYLRYEQTFDIKYIKYTEKGSWLLTDGNSRYQYYLQ